jgi:hypothetical protein
MARDMATPSGQPLVRLALLLRPQLVLAAQPFHVRRSANTIGSNSCEISLCLAAPDATTSSREQDFVIFS